MKKIIGIILMSAVLAGCANYTLVSPGRHSVKALSVNAGSPWNKAPSVAAPGGRTTWTADGLLLNRVVFFEGIEDGKPLYKASKKQQLPIFSADMLPNEIVESFEATLTRLTGSSITATRNLRPFEFAGFQGFAFDYEYVGGDDVKRRGKAAGTVYEDKLYMIAYEGADLLYFDRRAAEADRIIGSAVID